MNASRARSRVRSTALSTLLFVLPVACGARLAAPQTAAQSEPVDLRLRSADGKPVEFEALRGAPLLVFVFTTFDEASQLALTPLTRALRKHRELRALGLAVQPNPAQLLGLYSQALALEFPLAFDPDDRVIAGHTPLGAIETVPSYVLLDAEGRIVARHVGAMTETNLDEFFALAER